VAELALKGRCPRCGSGSLFKGWATFAPSCRNCGLDLAQFNVGDGPAAFLTLIVGAIVATLAVLFDLSWSPPFWVHILLWVPLTLALVIGLLRIGKAALLILEYRHRAAEGKLRLP
jgi:uncharacterized protein (DUF983 family)